MRWQALVFWPQAHLRQIGWVVIGGVALLMVDLFTDSQRGSNLPCGIK
jgi:hypothetical protein